MPFSRNTLSRYLRERTPSSSQAPWPTQKIIFCVGQGAWEDDGVCTLRHLQRVFEEKGIHAWCDFWGFDVNHDWPWWFRQMRYFLPYLLEYPWAD